MEKGKKGMRTRGRGEPLSLVTSCHSQWSPEGTEGKQSSHTNGKTMDRKRLKQLNS